MALAVKLRPSKGIELHRRILVDGILRPLDADLQGTPGHHAPQREPRIEQADRVVSAGRKRGFFDHCKAVLSKVRVQADRNASRSSSGHGRYITQIAMVELVQANTQGHGSVCTFLYCYNPVFHYCIGHWKPIRKSSPKPAIR